MKQNYNYNDLPLAKNKTKTAIIFILYIIPSISNGQTRGKISVYYGDYFNKSDLFDCGVEFHYSPLQNGLIENYRLNLHLRPIQINELIIKIARLKDIHEAFSFGWENAEEHLLYAASCSVWDWFTAPPRAGNITPG